MGPRQTCVVCTIELGISEDSQAAFYFFINFNKLSGEKTLPEPTHCKITLNKIKTKATN